VEVARVHYPKIAYGLFAGSESRNQLLTASSDEPVRLWNIQDWPPRQPFPGRYRVVAGAANVPFLAAPLTNADQSDDTNQKPLETTANCADVFQYPKNADTFEFSRTLADSQYL
jgi:hypothetical protein